jgi:hypothetical protein
LKCGHECLNECSKCQEYSAPQEELEEFFTHIERTQHGECKHICDRLLTCGHMCKHHCHEGNKCPPCVNIAHEIKLKKFKNRIPMKYMK